MKVESCKRQKGITLITLVVTVLFSYDEKEKCSNSKDYMFTIIKKYKISTL